MERWIKSDADIFMEAREYIAEHHWTQNELMDEQGWVCSLGGIVASQGWLEGSEINNAAWPTLRRLSRKLLNVIGVELDTEDHVNIVVNQLTGWNDDLPCGEHSWEASEQLVLDTFAKAEKIERAGFDPDA